MNGRTPGPIPEEVRKIPNLCISVDSQKLTLSKFSQLHGNSLNLCVFKLSEIFNQTLGTKAPIRLLDLIC